MEKKQYIWKEEQKALENTVNLKLWFRWNRQWITPKPQREANFKKNKANQSLTLLGAARQPASLFMALALPHSSFPNFKHYLFIYILYIYIYISN